LTAKFIEPVIYSIKVLIKSFLIGLLLDYTWQG